MIVIANEDLKLFGEIYALRARPPPPFWTDGVALVRAVDNAIRLVRTIASVHKLGVVHNSIRPTTVSLTVFNEVHLHDFSCAFHLSGLSSDQADSAPIRERGMKEESLPYLAPECTGRINKTADFRSDLYSVGATLFEIFTGQVPFADSVDPLEIVHAHIAKRPPLMSVIDPSVPHALCLIIAKLLEKDPQHRYQTSQGLIVDLERARDLIPTVSTPGLSGLPNGGMGQRQGSFSSDASSNATIGTSNTQFGLVGAEDFVVGSIDEAAYFRLPPASQLFGRDESIKQLKESFDRVKSSNKPAVAVVKGHSGIGKTSLIETLRAPASAARGHFTSVKFGSSLISFFLRLLY
jgi:serine/threonine protein kinase